MVSRKFTFFHLHTYIGEMKINFEVDTKEYWSMYGYTIYAIAPLPMYTSFFLNLSYLAIYIFSFVETVQIHIRYQASSRVRSEKSPTRKQAIQYIPVLSLGVKNTVRIRIRLVGALFSISTTYLPVKKWLNCFGIQHIEKSLCTVL